MTISTADLAHIAAIGRAPEQWGSQEVHQFTSARAMDRAVTPARPSREVNRDLGIAAAQDYLASKQRPLNEPRKRSRYDLLRGFYWRTFAGLVVVCIVALSALTHVAAENAIARGLAAHPECPDRAC